MSTLATKAVSAQAIAKPARLGYIYLYRMYRFNRLKEKLEKTRGKLAELSRKEDLHDIVSPAHDLRERYYEWRKGVLEERIARLAPKLASEEKLSSFVEKQRHKPGRLWRVLRDSAIIIPPFVAGTIAGLIVFSSLVPSALPDQFAAPIVVSLSLLIGWHTGKYFVKAKAALELGKKKARELASSVKPAA